MRRPLAALLLAASACAAGAGGAFAAGLSIAREPEIGLAVDKLDACGYLPGFSSSTRPFPVPAVRNAVGEAISGNRIPAAGFDRELADWVAWYLAPRAEGRLEGGVSLAERGGSRPLSDGVPVPRGASLAAGGSFRAEPARWLSFQGAGAAFLADEDDRGARLLESSAEAGLPSFSVEAGKISTAYGPGRNGGLVFSNNAAPYPGVRIRNPEPIPMPGFLSPLGTFRYDLFVARLEAGREVPHTMLSGFRLSLRQSRFLELGMSRAMHFGGEGRSSGLSAWWNAFKGTHENEEGNRGNQLAGFDAAVTLPFRYQPVRLYLEAAGEDEAKLLGTPIPAPTKWAFLGGVFLPAILGSTRADLRAEWATNHREGNGPSWYIHGDGYAHRYRGRILGHPMGTDARQLDLVGHWFFLPSTFLELSLGSLKRYSPGAGPRAETTTRMGAAFASWLTPGLRAEAAAGSERVRDAGGVAGARETDLSFRATLAWRIAARPR